MLAIVSNVVNSRATPSPSGLHTVTLQSEPYWPPTNTARALMLLVDTSAGPGQLRSAAYTNKALIVHGAPHQAAPAPLFPPNATLDSIAEADSSTTPSRSRAQPQQRPHLSSM